MKKVLFLLASLAVLQVHASHILGGMLAMTHDANAQPTNQSVALYLITDPQGIIASSQTVQVYIENNNFYQFSENLTLTRAYTDTMSDGNLLSTYVSAYQHFYMHKYRFIYSHCCRGTSVNASNSWNSDFLLGLDVDRLNAVNNNTPMPSYLPPVSLPQNITTTINLSNLVHDNFFEGDSIQYEMWDALSQHGNNTFIPLAPFNQIDTYGNYTVNGGGLTEWTPTMTGTFLTGYRLTEWRPNNIKASVCYMQHTFIVTPSGIGIEENIADCNTQYYVYDWYGRYMGSNIKWVDLKGLYVIKYSNGNVEKVILQ